MELQEVVFEAISHEIPSLAGTISLDTPLEELGIDSIKAITILFELEDKFNIEIPNDIFDSIQNVNDIIQQLEKLTGDSIPVCPSK